MAATKSDQLAVERAAWAVAIKQEFKFFPSFQFREHFNDYQTIFVVTRQDTPGWKAKITICSAHAQKNRLEVDGVLMGYSCKTATRHKAMALLQKLWECYDKDMAGKRTKEAEATKWKERQEMELAGLGELRGIDVEIIVSGPNAGKYLVIFHPGHPLEHMTAQQVKAFHAFAATI